MEDPARADLKRELEEYTGRDWGEFFDRWVYGKGVTDWEVKSVKVDNTPRRTWCESIRSAERLAKSA